eukprot:1766431-Pyramimonas_sp.AAC.1
MLWFGSEQACRTLPGESAPGGCPPRTRKIECKTASGGTEDINDTRHRQRLYGRAAILIPIGVISHCIISTDRAWVCWEVSVDCLGVLEFVCWDRCAGLCRTF